jgi:hypothetical protein
MPCHSMGLHAVNRQIEALAAAAAAQKGHSKHLEDCCFHREGLLDGVCDDARRCDAEDAPIYMTADSTTKLCKYLCKLYCGSTWHTA